jgi:hypothetical protein
VAPGPDDEPTDEASTDGDLGDDATAQDVDDDHDHSALPPRLESWRKRSATGAILTGLARGLQQVFEKEQEQPAIIMTTSGDPPKDLPVEAEVEQGRPRHSVVNIRPWLLNRPEADSDEATPDPDDHD